jgi:hypothetical protein
MKKLGNLLRKDIVLGIKDVFLLLEIVFSVIFMLVLLFLIPEEIRTEGPCIHLGSHRYHRGFRHRLRSGSRTEPGRIFRIQSGGSHRGHHR